MPIPQLAPSNMVVELTVNIHASTNVMKDIKTLQRKECRIENFKAISHLLG
jgi:hypothetical protein